MRCAGHEIDPTISVFHGALPSTAAHGFVTGRSTVTNARPHLGSKLLVKFDLRDFFPTIHYYRVLGLFARPARCEAGRLARGEWPELDAGKKLVLVTAHRRESFGHGFENICEALGKLAARGDARVVWLASL